MVRRALRPVRDLQTQGGPEKEQSALLAEVQDPPRGDERRLDWLEAMTLMMAEMRAQRLEEAEWRCEQKEEIDHLRIEAAEDCAAMQQERAEMLRRESAET